MSNLYDVLGVSESASQEDIKKSYRKKSLVNHPDRGGDAEKFKEISEAYETLGDKQKREMYDMQRKNPFMNHGFGGIDETQAHEEILKAFLGGNGAGGLFGGGNGFFGMPGGIRVSMNGVPMGGGRNADRMGGIHIFRNGQPVQQRPNDLELSLKITLNQAYLGSNVPLEIERTIIKYNEKRREKEVIYLDIPIGIDNNEIITLKEKGDIINDIKSDVKVTIKVTNDTNFERKGMDLIYEKEISLKESLIGFNFFIKHLSGKDYTINNNTGRVVTNAHVNVIKNMGMRRVKNKSEPPITGDMIIKFKVMYPEVITPEQRKIISEIL